MALYHSAKGSVNYTVVGNPTIVDGVISGFNDNQYVYANGTLDCSKNFEIVIATTTGTGIDDPDVPRALFRNEYNNAGNTGFAIGIQERKLTSFIIDSTGSWIARKDFGQNIFSDNTNYWFKFTQEKIGNNYIIELKSSIDSGVTWRFENSWTSTYHIRTSGVGCAFGGGSTSVGQYWTGTIDLKSTYITVNGQPWFGVCPVEVKKHQLMGPVGYTNVGGLTITDGVASGFSKNKYLYLGNFPQNVSDLEIQIKFKTGSASDADHWQGLFSICSSEAGHNVYLRYSRGGKQISFSPNFTYDNGNWILTSNTLEYETWYTYKISKVGNVYTLYKNGVAEATATSSVTIEPNNLETRLGYAAVYSGNTVGGFNSSIDLNETYIKVNGKLWFYQPAPTKYIVKDGKLVWADPRMYLQQSERQQYINTLYNIKANTNINLNLAYADGMTPLGVQTGGEKIYVLAGSDDPSLFGRLWLGSASLILYSVYTKSNIYTDGNKIYANGELKHTGGTPQDINAPLYLFARNNNGTVQYSHNGVNSKIYSLDIYEGYVLVRSFRPVPQGLEIGNFTCPSNGMFDIVNQQFYPNAGTGTFTIGRDE